MSPDVAPVGIVIAMDVALHELIVIGTAFTTTKLEPWEDPKFVPVIVTVPPTEPVVAETLVITGAGLAVELTETLSKVLVCKVPDVPLSTANPMYTSVAMLMVWPDPTIVQSTPSIE
jgi:hypothetical protein